MAFQVVDYFGMPVLAAYVNGTWMYQVSDRDLVPFMFQQNVRIKFPPAKNIESRPSVRAIA